MKKQFLFDFWFYSLCILLLTNPILLFAQSVPIDIITFNNGEPANANDVNQNFSELANAIEEIKNSNYLQLKVVSAEPPANDCQAETDRGKMTYHSSGFMYVCNGSQWDKIFPNQLNCDPGFYKSGDECKPSSPAGTIEDNWYSIPSYENGCKSVRFKCINGNCSIEFSEVGTTQYGYWNYGTIGIAAGEAFQQDSEGTTAWNGQTYWAHCSVFWDTADNRMKYKMWTNIGGCNYMVGNTGSCNGPNTWYNAN